MSWIIIVIIFILAAGPIFYLLPSAKDKRLSSLRTKARSLGFTVQLDNLLKLDPGANERVTAGGQALHAKISCVRYQLPLGKNLHQITPIILQRLPEKPTIPVTQIMEGWAVATVEASTDVIGGLGYRRWQRQEELLESIRVMLSHMPHDVLGLSIDARCVGVFWMERADFSAGDPAVETANQEPISLIYGAMREIINLLQSHEWIVE
jgi:hypothetical protein